MDNEIVAVPVGKGANQLHGVLKLNKEGCEVMEMLKENISEEEIIEQLSIKYTNERAQLIEYVKGVLEILREKNLIVE